MPKLLAIDDSEDIQHFFRTAFASTAFDVRTAGAGEAGLRCFREAPPDVVFLDVELPDVSGIDLLVQLRAFDPHLPVIIMTGHGDPELVIQAMQRGAFDYVSKPFGYHSLIERAESAVRQTTIEAAAEAPRAKPGNFLGRSPAMEDVFKTIGRVAATDANVLIQGESGTGKELVARTIWQHSRRAALPFVTVNCAALSESLMESELFGHEPGAFTGADRRHAGYFEQCRGGTLFLDEIGDMALTTQAKVLRVVQDGVFFRVGGEQPVRTNVRILAATNRNLHELHGRGAFRSDLYFRLNTCAVHVPPLRDRLADIPLLAHHFLAQSNGDCAKNVRGFSQEAMRRLEGYPWPGNVRELRAAVFHAVLNSVGPHVTEASLPPPVRDASLRGHGPHGGLQEAISGYLRNRLSTDATDLYDEVIGTVEQYLMREVMSFAARNQSTASRYLGLSRPTLRKKLRVIEERLGRTA